MGKEYKIIVHCLVKNEERFIWYALNSVLPYVDKIMVWDTGSTDQTIELIKTIKSTKIDFREVGKATLKNYTSFRQQMLDQTPRGYTWLMILDGDEIWTDQSIKSVTDYARKHVELNSLVVHTYNSIGDIYHKLPESAGRYTLAGAVGHLALRFMNLKTIKGLGVRGVYPLECYTDETGTPIQNLDPKKIRLLPHHYIHTTHLMRSSSERFDNEALKRKGKKKTELGIRVAQHDLPKILWRKRPDTVPDVTQPAPMSFWIKAMFLTLPKQIKRLFF